MTDVPAGDQTDHAFSCAHPSEAIFSPETIESVLCLECGNTCTRLMRWCPSCAALLAIHVQRSKSLVRCICGEWMEWTPPVEDPGVEQLSPYQIQRCSYCNASLEHQWIGLRRGILERIPSRVHNMFHRVIVLSFIAGLPAGYFGSLLFGETTFMRWLGAGVFFLVAAGICVVLAGQAPSLLGRWWGYAHGQCPCGKWLKDENRIDGFPDPNSEEEDSLWIAVWKCPKCEILLQSSVSFGSFV